MANIIKIKRGLSSNISNVTLEQGELAITTDTNELYIGTESGKIKLNESNSVLIYDTDSTDTIVEKLSSAVDAPHLTGEATKVKKDCYYITGIEVSSVKISIYKLAYVYSPVVEDIFTDVIFTNGLDGISLRLDYTRENDTKVWSIEKKDFLYNVDYISGDTFYKGNIYVGSTKYGDINATRLAKITEVPTNLVNGKTEGSIRTVNSTVEDDTYTLGKNAFSSGTNTKAIGEASHSEGTDTVAYSTNSHTEGYQTKTGRKAFLITNQTIDTTNKIYTFTLSSVEGLEVGQQYRIKTDTAYYTDYGGVINKIDTTNKVITTNYTFDMSKYNKCYLVIDSDNLGDVYLPAVMGSMYSSWSAHAEGVNTTAAGAVSHAEGQGTIALGDYSHAEGGGTKATNYGSHAEGEETTASGKYSHAEGYSTTAFGNTAHSEGQDTTAYGIGSHAEGNNTDATGDFSHSEGSNTKATGEAQHVQGKFNIEDTASAHIVGNGTSNSKKSNAHTVAWDGTAWYQGDVYVGSTSGKNKDDGSVKLAKITEVPTKTSQLTNDSQFITSADVLSNLKDGEAEGSIKSINAYDDNEHGKLGKGSINLSTKGVVTGENSLAFGNNTEDVISVELGFPFNNDIMGAYIESITNNIVTFTSNSTNTKLLNSANSNLYLHNSDNRNSNKNKITNVNTSDRTITLDPNNYDLSKFKIGWNSLYLDSNFAPGINNCTDSISLGKNNLVLFQSSTSNNSNSYVLGHDNKILNQNDFSVLGWNNDVGELDSYFSGSSIIGDHNTLRGNYNFLLGAFNNVGTTAFTDNNIVIGRLNSIPGSSTYSDGKCISIGFSNMTVSGKQDTILIGQNLQASNTQILLGKNNVYDLSTALLKDLYFVVSNGESGINTSDLFEIDNSGKAWFANDVYVGSTSGTNSDSGSKKLATEEYVDSKASSPITTVKSSETDANIITLIKNTVQSTGEPKSNLIYLDTTANKTYTLSTCSFKDSTYSLIFTDDSKYVSITFTSDATTINKEEGSLTASADDILGLFA